MNRSLAILIAGGALAAACQANASLYNSTDAKQKQQLVQSTTTSEVDTSGARAIALLDARNVAVSSQYSAPNFDTHRADVKAAAVYPQSGQATAAQEAKNVALSRQLPRQTMNLGTPAAERWMQEKSTP